MSAVNTDEGTILEALNNKTDRDMHNVDTVAKADAVIDYQIPTAENNYTWYRKYASGWVEQGRATYIQSTATEVVNFLVTMANSGYTISTCGTANVNYQNITTTSMELVTTAGQYLCWEIKGMAAA